MSAEIDGAPDDGTRSEAGDDASRLRRYSDAAHARVDAARELAEERRDRVRLVDAGFLIYESNRSLPAGFLIGALASRIVIYAVPFFALVVFTLGYFVDYTSSTATEAARNAGMVGMFAVAIEDSMHASDGVRATVLLATGWATLWAADSLARLVRRMYAVVWQVPLERTRYRLTFPLTVVALSLTAMALTGPGRITDDLPILTLALRVALEIVVLSAVWLVVTRSLPHDPGADGWKDFLPGAVLAAACLIAVRVAMVVYLVPKTATLQDRYGTISVAVVMLLWAYWIGALIVGSALVDAAAFRSRIRRIARPGEDGSGIPSGGSGADPQSAFGDPSPSGG